MTEHVSAFALDALALDALSPVEAARVAAHLDACERCRSDRDVAAEARARFVRRGLAAPRPRPRLAWLALPVLAAAALAFALWPRAQESDLGIKGDAAWQVFAHRGERTFEVHDGTMLAPGDRVRFVVIPGGAHYVTVASIDGAGAASIYYPSQRVDGPRVELPDSIVLDRAPGPERMFALLSEEPIDDEAVSQKLRDIRDIRATHRLDVRVRAQLTIVIEKDTP